MDRIFQFSSYRDFLRSKVGKKGARSGAKSQAAQAMMVHPAFLSRVMAGKADLSGEQTESLCRHFGLDAGEAKFFHLLVQNERAGTKDLRDRLREEIKTLKSEYQEIKKRIPKASVVSNEDRAIYYSKWYYAAIHVLVSIPGLRSSEDLGRYLNLPLKQVKGAVDFLLGCGLIEYINNNLAMGQKHIHGGSDLAFINQQHIAFRNLAIQSLDGADKNDFHYSGVVSLSRSDAAKISELLLSTLNEALKTVKASEEEVAYILNLDFFNLSSARGQLNNE